MQLLRRLVWNELWSPWLFGVGLFTVLIMAASYLMKVTDYVVKGVPLFTVAELVFLLTPGVLAKTFAMAVLLATLLGFGRLSNDSEIVALRAAGASLFQIMAPVALFGVLVAGVAFLMNETIVPAAAYRAAVIQSEIAQTTDVRGVRVQSFPVFDRGNLRAVIIAKDFSVGSRTIYGATINVYGDDGKTTFILEAPELEYRGEREWRIRGGARLSSVDGSQRVELTGDVWPKAVPQPGFTPEDLFIMTLRDLDSLSMKQTAEQIRRLEENPNADPATINNLQYGFYNKIALPLAAVIYALVGAPLGIRNHRSGTASGLWIAVLIIFAYIWLANFLNILAMSGEIPAYVASFAPLIIGMIAAVVLIWQKNK
jgi:lipopolysaccharide export system permease protein